MSELSIPTALNPRGNHVPIDEAKKKLEHYRCPECKEFVTPRIGPQRQYFAHKQGALDEKSCALASKTDVEEMMDKLRESDIEKEEKKRSIRVYLGQRHESRIECFGVIPSLEWNQISSDLGVKQLLEQMTISSEGIIDTPVPENFHPRESEIVFQLDPEADRFELTVDGPVELDVITGVWTANGLSRNDLFVGDQRRARRHSSNRQIKEGEWVYTLALLEPRDLPEIVTTYKIGKFHVLAFPAREKTKELLEDYGEEDLTDDYGFDANLMLPPDTHPTTEAPAYGVPNERVLVGVIPSDEIDPTFEVVSIPKREGDVDKLEPTGAGNPRYYSAKVPQDGSKRISIHQRGSERHEMVHLHPVSVDDRLPRLRERNIGLRIIDENPTLVSPLEDKQSYEFPPNMDPYTLPARIEYIGPDGLNLEATGQFIDEAQFGSRTTHVTSKIDKLTSNISNWVANGCKSVRIAFVGVGAVELTFPQPGLAVKLDQSVNTSNSNH